MDRLTRFAWSVLAYNVAVILWGAYVRASGSGAGCGSHWPLCNGELVPRAPEAATLIEFSHRVTSGLALLLVVALLAWVRRARAAGDPARSAATAATVFMLGEAAVGAGLVLFELVADDRSTARALFMATHLVNTFFLLGSLVLTAHFAAGGGRSPRSAVRPAGEAARSAGAELGRARIAAGVFGLLLVGVSGAVAALGDTLYPAGSLGEEPDLEWLDTAQAFVQLRVLHPLISVVTGAGLVMMSLRYALRRGPAAAAHPARPYAGLVVALTLLQLACGALNVLLLAPVWMQLVHLLLADLLWIAFVLMSATALAARADRALPPRVAAVSESLPS